MPWKSVLSVLLLCGGQGARYCREGDKVWLAESAATVLSRNSGAAEVLLEESLQRLWIPITKLRTRFGQLCASAALCLFGRVGNLEGKFHEGGSNEEALAVSASSVWEHVVRGNWEMNWDIFAHTWDEDLADSIRRAYRPQVLRAEAPGAAWSAVESFGESVRRSSELRRKQEMEEGFRYDLVVLMRYDILFRRRLDLLESMENHTLWTGHWCSIHSEDLAVREVVLTPEADLAEAPDERFQSSGVFAPSQFATTGLHDFWFAAPSVAMDAFAAWAQSRPWLLARYGLQSEEIPVDVGHFHTYLHAKDLGLQLRYTGISYVDFTLVRYGACHLDVGEEISPPDVFCSHWEISITRQCAQWLPKEPGWAHQLCPLAGRRASLRPNSRGCGRF